MLIQGHKEFRAVNVPGYPGFSERYGVNIDGEVLSFPRKGQPEPRILNPAKDSIGYRHVVLVMDGFKKLVKVHRLVMLTFQFIENHRSMVVNHIDEVKTNNQISNLEWVTYKENAVKYRENHPKRIPKKAVRQEHKNVYLANKSQSVQELADALGENWLFARTVIRECK